LAPPFTCPPVFAAYFVAYFAEVTKAKTAVKKASSLKKASSFAKASSYAKASADKTADNTADKTADKTADNTTGKPVCPNGSFRGLPPKVGS
jgi:hypothetical protein